MTTIRPRRAASSTSSRSRCRRRCVSAATFSALAGLEPSSGAQIQGGERTALKEVVVYGDGACLGNPGPGGYGVVLLYKSIRRELSQGFRLTTNNRMELLAAVIGLEALKEPCRVLLHSDSRYLVDGMAKGWARAWRSRGWRLRDNKPALNPDLWGRLLDLCDRHQVTFVWVRGHNGDIENERCDAMAFAAARGPELSADKEYERSLAFTGRERLL